MPKRIVRGPDDNLWLTTYHGPIWRLHLAGRMAPILSLDANIWASDISVGPRLGAGGACGRIRSSYGLPVRAPAR